MGVIGGIDTFVGMFNDAMPGSLGRLDSFATFFPSTKNLLLGDKDLERMDLLFGFSTRRTAVGVVGAVRLRLTCGSTSETELDFSISL